MTGELAVAAYVGAVSPQIEDQAVHGEFAAGGTLRLRYGPRWALELQMGSAGTALDPRAEVLYFVGNPSADIVAFLALGAGSVVGEARSDGLVQGGIGLEFALFSVLDLRVDGRYRYGGDSGSALLFTIGPELHTVRAYDIDHDGVPDHADRCPKAGEDLDGYADEDGCPDPDNDRDGVIDAADTCRDSAEDHDGFLDSDGCPEPDNDADSLADARDACANQPEDKDGFQDLDGCPDVDNDTDAILDVADRCPNVPEDADGWEDDDGCPDPDNDGDGVGDRFDAAPNAPENLNFFEDEDGVPEVLPPVLDRFLGSIPKIRFSRRQLTERAADTLELLGTVLGQYPSVHLSIRVSAPDVGEANDRALTLAATLVELGVRADRLEPAGLAGAEGVTFALVP